ncbi:hypothetical protein BD626DRAFT_265106 [Schizophyllum amplum]|uniref:Uncharacterized protein n=1 Tax=Schizophyllum amplum TaxID=97359 RepID=A0A550CGY8_9AGAR|nr:hypothetical protein BD626DRAFT_265106 [Auriculariopsis ampla]
MSVEDTLNCARAMVTVSLHRSAYVPSTADATLITEKAQTLSAMYSEVDAEIRKLQRQKRAIRAQIPLHHAIVSPWRRLPREIMSEIFLLALPMDWMYGNTGRRGSLNLTGVCHAWRVVVLNTPRIWANLRFDGWNPLARHTKALRAELDKTSQVPLTLDIDLSRSGNHGAPMTNPEDAWSNEGWEILCSQSHRWSSVDLDSLPLAAYASLSSRAFPILESLRIGVHAVHRNEDAKNEIPLDCFHNAPALANLAIFYDGPIVPFTMPPTLAITDLTILCSDSSDERAPSLLPCLEAILATCDTLQQCTITARNFLIPAHPKPVTFPALRKLTLDDDAVSLCRFIAAPNLEAAVLTGSPDWGTGGDGLAAMTTLLHNRDSSGCKALRQLNICGLPARPEDAIRFLHQVPQLTNLVISNEDPEDAGAHDLFVSIELLKGLSRDSEAPGAATLLPNLLRLSVDSESQGTNAHRDPENQAVLRAIVASRTCPRVVDGVALACLEKFTA